MGSAGTEGLHIARAKQAGFPPHYSYCSKSQKKHGEIIRSRNEAFVCLQWPPWTRLGILHTAKEVFRDSCMGMRLCVCVYMHVSVCPCEGLSKQEGGED